jgi:hypothetical protein
LPADRATHNTVPASVIPAEEAPRRHQAGTTKPGRAAVGVR